MRPHDPRPKLKDPRDRLPNEDDIAPHRGPATALEAVRRFFPSLDEPRARTIAHKLFAQPRTASAIVAVMQAEAPDLFEEPTS